VKLCNSFRLVGGRLVDLPSQLSSKSLKGFGVHTMGVLAVIKF